MRKCFRTFTCHRRLYAKFHRLGMISGAFSSEIVDLRTSFVKGARVFEAVAEIVGR